MLKFDLTEMFKGWFVGNFDPTAFKTGDVEVAVKRYNQGDYEAKHYHKVATELTVILTGEAEMNGVKYKKDDIILMKPGEATDFRALTDDVATVVVKHPCVKDDKFLCDSRGGQ